MLTYLLGRWLGGNRPSFPIRYPTLDKPSRPPIITHLLADAYQKPGLVLHTDASNHLLNPERGHIPWCFELAPASYQ